MPLPQANLLSEETSPYLHQHKDNPVHWRPWSEATLAEARELDRPILLSVGYAACHWCHVMAHECFEDPEVAGLMNRLYVNIKVDREERPDIDQIYMAALSATGEQGGWPLTMFLTPDAQPFWGGTYFPKQPRYGRPGFLQVLESIDRAWKNRRNELAASAETLKDHVDTRLSARQPAAAETARGQLPGLASGIHSMIDQSRGGLRGAPKFPNAPFMQTLWLNWLEAGEPAHRDAVLLSLRHMLNGGIYDHVGGGLCRYSTDAEWLVPHFEKMLYDNAMLIRLANWAFADTGEQLFRDRIETTISWLLREMRVGGGGFAASLDADSDGEEGSYYTWDQAEIDAVLGNDAPTFFSSYTLAAPHGWEGKPIIRSHARRPRSRGDEVTAGKTIRDTRKTCSPQPRQQGARGLERPCHRRARRGIAQPEPTRLAGLGRRPPIVSFPNQGMSKGGSPIRSSAIGASSRPCPPTTPRWQTPQSPCTKRLRMPAYLADAASHLNALDRWYHRRGESGPLPHRCR